jgi:DNA-binding MarR family transcriptional regulator
MIREATALSLDTNAFQGLAGFRSALRRFLAASEGLCREGGVTPQQYQAMLAIKTRPAETMAIKHLAEQLLLTHHATVQLVDRLCKAGLVARQPSPSDRRSVLVALTSRGEGVLDELAVLHLQEMLRQEPQLSSSLQRLRGCAA